MRFMIIVKATTDSEEKVMPSEELYSAMQKYHEELRELVFCSIGLGCSLAQAEYGFPIQYLEKNRKSLMVRLRKLKRSFY